jgi:putative membrane protein
LKNKKAVGKDTVRTHHRVDHLANERTFLAWIRTSIGLMAFGFVVEKFALFMKQITYFFGKEGSPESAILTSQHQGYSSIFGVLLVALGALIGLFSFIKYKENERQIEEDTYQPSSILAILLTISVVVVGIFLAAYLT